MSAFLLKMSIGGYCTRGAIFIVESDENYFSFSSKLFLQEEILRISLLATCFFN